MWSPQQFSERTLSGRDRIELRERLAARIPDRPEAWYLIGDAYFHSGAAYGYGFREALIRAETAFRRALALDPGITYIQRHIVDIANFSDDPFQRVPALIDSLNLDSPDYLLSAAIMKGDSAHVKRLLSNLTSLDLNELMGAGFISSYLGLPELGDTAFAVAIGRPTTATERRGMYRARRTMLISTGRPAAAARMTEALEQLGDGSAAGAPFALDAVLAGVFVDGDTVSAARAAQRFTGRMHAVPGVSVANRRTAAWGAGLWASYRADSSTLATAIAILDTLASVRDTSGAAALSRLEAEGLKLVSPNASPDRRVLERLDSLLSVGPVVAADTRAALNLIVARTFEKLGDTRRALRAASRVSPGEVLYVMGTPAGLDQARLNLAVGDTALAITIYRWYLLGRRAAEPPQKKADEVIQKKLDELLRLRR